MSKKSSFLGYIFRESQTIICNIYPVCQTYLANLSVELCLALLKAEQEIFNERIKVNQPVQIELPTQPDDDCLLVTIIADNHNIPVELFSVELICDQNIQTCPRFVKPLSGVLLYRNKSEGEPIYIIHLDNSSQIDIVEDDVKRQIKISPVVHRVATEAKSYVFINCSNRYIYPVSLTKVGAQN